MKNSLKILSFILVLFLVPFIFIGCGKKSDISEISLITYKNEFVVGEEFTLSDFAILIKYKGTEKNDDIVNITEKMIVESPDFSLDGQTSLKVKYNKKEYTLNITVVKYFTINYLDNDGNLFMSYQIKKGQKLETIPSLSPIEGKKFTGWETDLTDVEIEEDYSIKPIFEDALITYSFTTTNIENIRMSVNGDKCEIKLGYVFNKTDFRISLLSENGSSINRFLDNSIITIENIPTFDEVGDLDLEIEISKDSSFHGNYVLKIAVVEEFSSVKFLRLEGDSLSSYVGNNCTVDEDYEFNIEDFYVRKNNGFDYQLSAENIYGDLPEFDKDKINVLNLVIDGYLYTLNISYIKNVQE